MDDKRYWAFLSYSHADREWAGWLHRALEAYVVPRRLVGRETAQGVAPKRFTPIFRDREELSADAHLADRVQDALMQSAYLIVLCSPAAAGSTWVQQEIVRFKTLHGEDRVLAAIVAGEPHASAIPGREAEECFPAALRFRLAPDGSLSDDPAEPIAADLRPGQDGRRLTRLKLIARMLDVGLDDLIRRDAQRRQTQLAVAAAGAGAVALGMGALAVAAVIARNEAVAARDEARVQRGQAEGLVEFMVGDLQEKLEPKVRLDVLGSVADRAMAYYAVQSHHGLDADALGRRSRVMAMLGWIEQDRGDLGKAQALLEEASSSAGLLLAHDPNNPQRLYERARIDESLGNIAVQQGQLPRAEDRWREAIRLTDTLVAKGGRKPAWLTEQASAQTDVGIVLLKEQRPRDAVPLLRQAVALQNEVERRTPGNRQRVYELTQDIAWLADAERATGDVDAALHDRETEDGISLQLLKTSADDREARLGLSVSRVVQSQMLLGQGRIGAALDLARRATADAEAAVAGDPGDTFSIERAVAASRAVGEAALTMDDMAVAAPAADRAVALAETLAKKDPSISDWNLRLLGGARLLQIRVAARRAHGLQSCLRALAPAVPESRRLEGLARTDRALGGVSPTVAQGVLLRGDISYLKGSPRDAGKDWTTALNWLTPVGATSGTPVNPYAVPVLDQLRLRRRLLMVSSSRQASDVLQPLTCGAGK